MTETDKIQLEKDTLWQREKARKEVGAIEVKVEQIAGALDRIVRVLRERPEALGIFPVINTGYDPREDIKSLDRQLILDTCRDLTQAKERLRLAEKQLLKLQFGSPQTRIDIGDTESEGDLL